MILRTLVMSVFPDDSVLFSQCLGGPTSRVCVVSWTSELQLESYDAPATIEHSLLCFSLDTVYDWSIKVPVKYQDQVCDLNILIVPGSGPTLLG